MKKKEKKKKLNEVDLLGRRDYLIRLFYLVHIHEMLPIDAVELIEKLIDTGEY